jgi:hypothetical protein
MSALPRPHAPGAARLGRRGFLRGALAAATLAAAGPLPAAGPRPARAAEAQDAVVRRWNDVALEAIRLTRPGPPQTARALAILHTAIFDAWAAYDATAVGTRLDGDLRRPTWERTSERKREAVSYAAYRALVDLYPSEARLLGRVMLDLGYDPTDASADPRSPRGVGNLAARTLLAFRHHDGSNQLGDRNFGPYSDYTDYGPLNDYDRVDDPNRWQPLRTLDYRAGFATQRCAVPHWGRVTPFAMAHGAEHRPSATPPMYPSPLYRDRAEELLAISGTLTDEQKAVAEYWADGPASELPPGHWCRLAHWVAVRDGHDLDADVKLFFALTNAVFDAGIAAWDCKMALDYVRPITAIRFLYKGQRVPAWGGPYVGTRRIDGADWRPYQSPTTVTPPFPEFVSGHSTFSAAAAEVLARFTGSDAFGARFTLKAGASKLEPGLTPVRDVTLAWPTFSAAADEAGMSRRYGGIHFADGDLIGRAMGRAIGAQAWARAQRHVEGSAPPAS